MLFDQQCLQLYCFLNCLTPARCFVFLFELLDKFSTRCFQHACKADRCHRSRKCIYCCEFKSLFSLLHSLCSSHSLKGKSQVPSLTQRCCSCAVPALITWVRKDTRSRQQTFIGPPSTTHFHSGLMDSDGFLKWHRAQQPGGLIADRLIEWGWGCAILSTLNDSTKLSLNAELCSRTHLKRPQFGPPWSQWMPRIMTMNGDHRSVATAPLDLRTTSRDRGTPNCKSRVRDAPQGAETGASRKRPADKASSRLPFRKRPISLDPESPTQSPTQTPAAPSSEDRISPAVDFTVRQSVAGQVAEEAEDILPASATPRRNIKSGRSPEGYRTCCFYPLEHGRPRVLILNKTSFLFPLSKLIVEKNKQPHKMKKK